MKYKAFTLVELLVVITLLWILSTVAFVSYMGYSENSRDSARISNLTKLEKSLEARKAKAWEYPTPDESSDVKYLGKTIFTQWTLGTRTKKHLKFQAEWMDPKYEADYTYSVTANGDRFEIWTIMEDGTNNTLGLFSNTYASEDDVALNHGNFNWKFYSTKVNGETHVFTIPSLILKNKSWFEVITNNPTSNFAITGAWGLPETYTGKSKANQTVNFTPRLLYKGPNCGVETDQEIVNFVATLRDSFNIEPFISDSTYNSVFEDFEYLRNNIDDFETLEEIGIKINEALGCHIKNFKTTDIFPTQCGYETLDFEWLRDINWHIVWPILDGFNIQSDSCLFTYSWNGSAVVRDNTWVGNSKWLHVTSWTLKYRVFTYVPMKFEFDVTSTTMLWSSRLEFYINGNKYLSKWNGDDYSNGYEKYKTTLLAPWLYDFEWKVIQSGTHDTQVWIDNLNFTCQWGWPGCGWTYWFEYWDSIPYEMFSFDGAAKTPWQIIEDNTEWNFAIVNPEIPNNSSASISYKKTLTKASRLSFDYKIDDYAWAIVKLYIDDVGYKHWWYGIMWDDNPTTYGTYTTPLLEAWEHEIKLIVLRNWHPDHKTFLYLDNFKTYCEVWDTGCNMDASFEPSDTPMQYGYFSFDWETTTPWWLENDPEHVTDGLYSMRSPVYWDSNPTYLNTFYTYMNYHKDFDEPAKISFKYKLDHHWGWAKFYIDGIEYKHLWYQWENPGTWFNTFTTPLLTGQHTIRIEILRNWNNDNYTYLYLDDFKVSCLWGVLIPGNEDCGWSWYEFENWSNNPLDMFDFTWGIDVPWMTTTWSWGTLAIKSPKWPPNSSSYLSFKENVSAWESLKFDMDLDATCWWSVQLNVNWLKEEKWWYQWVTSLMNYETFTTQPFTSSGLYEFDFIIKRLSNSCTKADLSLDNLRFE